VVYPTARAAGPTLSVLAAMLILGERPGQWALLGGVLIVAGVVALVWEPGGPSRDRARASVAFGLLVGGIIGCYTLWDAYAVSALLIPPLLLDYVATLGRLVMLSPHALRRRASISRIWREHHVAVLGVAILSPLSYILVLTALVFTPVSYVAPAREVSVLFAVLIGGQLLGEGRTGRRLLAALVMLAGIVVLATG
jgi:drug/metabolite transporter (DMT)-like permease